MHQPYFQALSKLSTMSYDISCEFIRICVSASLILDNNKRVRDNS